MTMEKEIEITAEDQSTMITEAVAKVAQITQAKANLETLLSDTRELLAALSKLGIDMKFPVLNESPATAVVTAPITAAIPTEETVLAVPVIPPGVPPPTEAELAAEEELAQQGDLSQPLPGGETRSAEVLAKEAMKDVKQDETFNQSSIENKFNRAVTGGFIRSQKLAEDYKG